MKTRKLVARYLVRMDELHTRLTEFLTNSSAIAPNVIADKVEDYLLEAYLEGFAGVGYLLGDDSETVCAQRAMSVVNKLIGGKTFRDRVVEHAKAGDYNSVLFVAATDGHRVFNAGSNDRANAFQLRGNWIDKTWVTVADNNVRDTHRYLQGESVGLFDRFYTYDNDSALFPGDFSRVENNAGCRCILSYAKRE